MKLKESLRNLRKKVSKKSAIITVALVLGVIGGSVAGVRYTSAFNGDCDANAVMYCGGETVGALQAKYNKSADVRNIYAAAPFKLSSQKMASSWSGMQRGEVGRDGVVKLNGKTVATNAVTAGRNYGNTPAIRAASRKMPGVNAYSRPAGANMGPNTYALTAFIKLDSNGRFEFAIIRSCGNPVVATPTQPPANPSISIEKLVKKAGTNDQFKDDITVSPSQKVEYVVGVKNTGNVALHNVHVLDALPKELKYVGYTTKVVRSYGAETKISSITTGARNIGTIPVHGTAFVFFQATAPSVDTAIKTCDAGKTRLRNTAYVSSDQTGNKKDDADIQTCKPPTPKKPAFEIEKKVKKAGTTDEFSEDISVNPGDKVEYVVAVKNTGDVDLTNMWVRDELPQNVRYVGYTTRIVTSYGVNKGISNIVGKGVNIGTVPVGGTAFIFFEATAPKATDTNVKECKDGKTNLRNIAFANPDQLGRKDDDAYIKTCKTVTPKNPDFEIVKKVKKAGTTDEFSENVEAVPGTKLTYVIAVKNTGDTTLKNVLVKDVLPAGMKYVTGSAKITISGGVNNQPISDTIVTSGYTIDSLGINQSAFIFFDANLPEATNPNVKECEVGKTKLINKANAKPENLPVKEDEATAETCKPPVEKDPGVSIDKKVNNKKRDEVAVGELFTYQLVIKNTGDVDLKNADVQDVAPAGVELISADKGVINETKLRLSYVIPELKVNESVTINIKAKVTAYKAGELVNTACVNAKEVNPGQPKVADDCDTAIVTVTPETPVYECTSLDAAKLGDLQYRFTPQINKSVSVEVSKTSYNFGDGSAPVVQNGASPAEHTYAKLDAEKTYTITATVTFVVDGQEKSVDCKTQIKIPAEPVLTYECTSLGAISLGDLRYRFTPQISMSSSVKVTQVSYNFGDGTDAVVRNDANSVEHTYTQLDVDKTYTATATVAFSVGGETKSVDCAAQVKITATPDVPCEYNPELPKDHPECKPPVVPPVTPPVTPPTTPQPPVSIIPATGLGGALSGLVGTFAATYGGYALLEARRKRA